MNIKVCLGGGGGNTCNQLKFYFSQPFLALWVKVIFINKNCIEILFYRKTHPLPLPPLNIKWSLQHSITNIWVVVRFHMTEGWLTCDVVVTGVKKLKMTYIWPRQCHKSMQANWRHTTAAGSPGVSSLSGHINETY